jgi:hypothetical protein
VNRVMKEYKRLYRTSRFRGVFIFLNLLIRGLSYKTILITGLCILIGSCSNQNQSSETASTQFRDIFSDSFLNSFSNSNNYDSMKIFIFDVKSDKIVFSECYSSKETIIKSKSLNNGVCVIPGGLMKPYWAAILLEHADVKFSDQVKYNPSIKIFDIEIKDAFNLKTDSINLFNTIVYSSNTGIVGFLSANRNNKMVRRTIESLQPKELESGISLATAAVGYSVKWEFEKLMRFYGQVAEKSKKSEFSQRTLTYIDTFLANSVRIGSSNSIYDPKNPIHGKSATYSVISDKIQYESRFVGFENNNRRFVVGVIMSGDEISYGSQASAALARKVLLSLSEIPE